MHCRSVLLLEQEIRHLEANPLWGITIYQVPKHPLICFASISGLKGCLLEKAIFHVTLYFSEHYNEDAPEVIFNTIPFHPNVHPVSGLMVADFLNNFSKRNQGRELNLANLLINVQDLLSNPVFENVVNDEASKMLRDTPDVYHKVVQRCVEESIRLHAMFEKNVVQNMRSLVARNRETPLKLVKYTTPEEATAPILKPKQVSFDVYHRGWVEVATTKPFATKVTSDEDADRVTLQMWHPNYSSLRSLSPSSSIRVPSRSKNTHSTAQVSKVELARKKKIEKVEALKQLYLNKPENERVVDIGRAVVSENTGLSSLKKLDPSPSDAWEAEADELLAWTDGLNAERMMAS